MRVVLSQYLRTLRERDELDALLPVLVGEMGYTLLSRPQAGTRQYGVDFASAGPSPLDGIDELLLFVIKQGDIGRREWTGSPQAVRESMDEIFDVWLRAHVPSGYEQHRKVIVVATSGDLKQEVEANWVGYTAQKATITFQFWGSDKISELLERHLLDENLFRAEDWSDLRRALALAADNEYRFEDFGRLLLRQLSLDRSGARTDAAGRGDAARVLVKALRRIHLAASICAYWAESDGNVRQAVWVMERTLLWCWHRVLLDGLQDRAAVAAAFADLWRSYLDVSERYVTKIARYTAVQDGLSVQTREASEYALVLMEQVGLLGSIGLSQSTSETDIAGPALPTDSTCRALIDLLRNHEAAASPRLDEHCIDVSLALALLVQTGNHLRATEWLTAIASRLIFTYQGRRLFPIATDSLEDLAELDVFGGDELKDKLLQTSWMMATVASWCAVLHLDQVYEALASSRARNYPHMDAQLWHPQTDWPTTWYFKPAHHETGLAEAPYDMPPAASELRARIARFNESRRLQWEENSPSLAAGMWGLDFIACRHFRVPVPASVWYQVRPPGHQGTSSVELTDDGSEE